VTTVTRAPLSAEEWLATWRFPLKLMTFDVLCCTTVIPVSFTLKSLFGENFTFSILVSRTEKKTDTFHGPSLLLLTLPAASVVIVLDVSS
jgi:hypothetical protein